MNRIQTFQNALKMVKDKYEFYPDYFVLESVIAQLEYLLGVAKGEEKDMSKLKTIIIGRMAARDIDNWDDDLANALYLSADEAKKMLYEIK